MSFEPLIELELGNRGKDYVNSCLDQGAGLCTKLLQRISHSPGRCFAPLPEHVSFDRAILFEEGGLTSRRASMEWLFYRFRSMPDNDGQMAVVFQDVWAKPTDPAFRRSPHSRFFTECEVYYLARRIDTSRYVFQDTIKSIMSYLFVAFLSRVPAMPTTYPTAPVDEIVIDEIARAALEIYVSAYDQEGLVVWSSNT